jgi:uncharacterized membrane protein YgcG
MRFLETMRGPDFLVLYLVWFALTWIGMLVVRHRLSNTMWTSLGGLLVFEGLGAARYLVGEAHGMHNWDFLFMMMGIGALFFVMRAQKSGSDGGSGIGGCGGGGCGGGGCGGGGCGGCGGS